MKRGAALMVSVLLLAGCTSSPPFEAQLVSALADSDGTFELSSLAAVDGDEFLVVCPYESTTSIDERLGFEWADAPDYSRIDDRQTIAIVNDEAVTSHAEFARDEIDFCSDGSWRVLSTDTELTVSRSGGAIVITRDN